MIYVRQLDGRLGRDVSDLASWWSQASQEARYTILRAAINGDPKAPPLKTLQLAIIAAEIEAGEIGEG